MSVLTRRLIAWWTAAIFLLLIFFTFIAMFAIGVWLSGYWTSDVQVTVEVPSVVNVGDVFPVSIVVRNTSDSVTAVWTGVGVDESLVSGLSSLSIDSSVPDWRWVDYSFGEFLYQYSDMEIPPLADRRISFRLNAERTGTFSGRVYVYVRHRYFSTSVPVASSLVRIDARREDRTPAPWGLQKTIR